MEAASEYHTRAAARHDKLADESRAAGERGDATKHSTAAQLHRQASAELALGQSEDDGGGDDNDDNDNSHEREGKVTDNFRLAEAAAMSALDDAADIPVFNHEPMALIAALHNAESRKGRGKSSDGGNVPSAYPQYQLPTSSFDRGRMLQGSGWAGSFAADMDSTAMMSGMMDPNDYPQSDYYGGTTGSQYDPRDYHGTPMKHLQGRAEGSRGVPGLTLLEEGDVAAVDAERARRLGLDTGAGGGPPTVPDSRVRNALGIGPDPLVLSTPNWGEIVRNQRRIGS
jgi:hypothetical protein